MDPSKKEKIFLILTIGVLAALAALRLVHLGYSDYIPDETTVMDYFKENGPSMDFDYLARQRKGPMQWLTVLPVDLAYKNVFNELVFRAPFALANILSIVFFHKFLLLHTENRRIALLAAFLFGVNGFIVAFGRVVQYQSLNLLFSTISLYYFVRFLKESKKKFCVLGAVFFAFSLLAHWDAIFILPYIIWVLVVKKDVKAIFLSGLVAVALTVPFIVPFAMKNYFSGEYHAEYFSGRVGVRDNLNLSEVRFKNSLYNPFLFTTFCVLFMLVSLIWLKDYKVFWIWFAFTLAVFLFFARAPGTHTYNLLIPMIILCSVGYIRFSELIWEDYRIVMYGFLVMVGLFLYYQSFLIFTDTSKEYPWEREKIFRYRTRVYDHTILTNNIIGFPHGRNWFEVRNYIQTQEGLENYTFSTNENSAMASFYLDIDYAESKNMYLIGVKNPYSFVSDYQFSQIGGKYSVKSITNKSGETVVKIYKTY